MESVERDGPLPDEDPGAERPRPGSTPSGAAEYAPRSAVEAAGEALERLRSRGSGLAPHRAGALAYLAGAFSGALFLVLDEDDPYVRFHALQSIALTVAWVVLWLAVLVLALLLGFLPLVGGAAAVFLRFAVAVGSLGVWLRAMTRAWRGEEWEIPFLGALVRRLEEEPGEAGLA